MLKMDESTSIRTMHDRGASIRVIAHDLHLSRNTVRRYLRSDQPPAFHGSTDTQAALAPFQKRIRAMLDQGFLGSRIYEELRKQGYSGPQASFYRYLAPLRKAQGLPDVIHRFETAPAHQAQYDWSEYVIPSLCAPVKVYVSCLILGYSRFRHYSASLDIKQPSIFEALEAGFAAFGGVPKEVLFDNPRALVIRTRPHLVWNSALLALSGHYGFLPRACWPYRAQTKGKVENPFRYLETHFITGLTWLGFPDFQLRLRAFEQEVNQRPHGTTGVPPKERRIEEQPLLILLPDHPFISPLADFRHVTMDGLIAFDRRRYSVPWQYAGKTVWIKLHAGAELEIYSQSGNLLTRHTLEHGPRRVIIKPEHYEGLRQYHQQQKTILQQAFQVRFPDSGAFLEKLSAQYKYSATDQLRRILTLADYYSPTVMKAAFEQAVVHNTFSANFVRALVEQLTTGDLDLGGPAIPHQTTLPGFNVQPDLNRYQQLLERTENKKVSNE
jgi:transposase